MDNHLTTILKNNNYLFNCFFDLNLENQKNINYCFKNGVSHINNIIDKTKKYPYLRLKTETEINYNDLLLLTYFIQYYLKNKNIIFKFKTYKIKKEHNVIKFNVKFVNNKLDWALGFSNQYKLTFSQVKNYWKRLELSKLKNISFKNLDSLLNSPNYDFINNKFISIENFILNSDLRNTLVLDNKNSEIIKKILSTEWADNYNLQRALVHSKNNDIIEIINQYYDIEEKIEINDIFNFIDTNNKNPIKNNLYTYYIKNYSVLYHLDYLLKIYKIDNMHNNFYINIYTNRKSDFIDLLINRNIKEVECINDLNNLKINKGEAIFFMYYFKNNLHFGIYEG